jgi:hypothetical protein
MKTILYKKTLIVDVRRENCSHNWSMLLASGSIYFQTLKQAKDYIKILKSKGE